MRRRSLMILPLAVLTSLSVLILFSISVFGQEKEVELRVLTYLTGWFNSNSYVEKNIPLFEAAHPGVKVDYQINASGQTLAELIVVEAAGGVSSDVLFLGDIIDNIWRNIVSQPSLVMDLQPFLERDKDLDRRDFFPNLLQAFTHNGRLIGMPMSTFTSSTFINKTLFEEFGLAQPTAGWDWNGLREISRKLTQDKNNDGVPETWGFAADGYTLQYQGATVFLWANGADIVTSDHSRAALLEPQAVEALEYFYDLHFVDRVAVPPGAGAQWTLFRQGHVGIWESKSSNIPKNRAQCAPHVDWDITVPFRSPRTGAFAPLIASNIASISATSKHPELAWEFIKFLFLSDRAQQAMAADEGMLPIRISFARHFTRVFQGPPANVAPLIDAVAIGRTPVWFQDSQVQKDVYDIIGVEWDKVIKQQQSVRVFAEKVTPLINARLQ
ncbi:MAG: sugar ABC transporter substrate-binding protein [Firmicutes bacterium]|nr:sugar ABC transporter substrate-binding protein [Bacillota bacterium]